MRTTILLSFLALTALAGESTFEQTRVPIYGGFVVTNWPVASNTLARVVSWQGTISNNGQRTNLAATFACLYPGDTQPQRLAMGEWLMGPGAIFATVTDAGNWGESAHFLVERQAVNVRPSLDGTTVLPAGSAGAVALESSTDLATWSETKPGEISNSVAHVFFRVKLTLQK